MIRITILEDEAPQLDRLISFLKRYEQETPGTVLDIRSYDHAMNLLDSYRCDTDLLLLDIQLPGNSGLYLFETCAAGSTEKAQPGIPGLRRLPSGRVRCRQTVSDLMHGGRLNRRRGIEGDPAPPRLTLWLSRSSS